MQRTHRERQHRCVLQKSGRKSRERTKRAVVPRACVLCHVVDVLLELTKVLRTWHIYEISSSSVYLGDSRSLSMACLADSRSLSMACLGDSRRLSMAYLGDSRVFPWPALVTQEVFPWPALVTQEVFPWPTLVIQESFHGLPW